MAVYMIDYENVKTGGLNGISRLTESDHVIIFYSENANRLTFDLHQRLMASPAKIEYREVTVGGHNALDFQLVTYLGFLIAQNPTGPYLIISNDRGFDYVVNFWRKDGLSVGLLSYLNDPAYATQKALNPDGKAAAAAVAAPTGENSPEEETFEEEPIEEPATEPEVIVATAEPMETEAPAPAEVVAEPVAEAVTEPTPEPAEDVIFEETAPAPVAVEAPAAPAAPPVSAEVRQEKPKPAKKKKKSSASEESDEQPAPQEQDKPADAPAAKSAKKPAAEPARPAKEKDKGQEPEEEQAAPAEVLSEETRAELRAMLGDSVADDPELRFVLSCVEKYKTKMGLNNALVKRFGSQKAGEIYQKIKPLLSAKKSTDAKPTTKQKNAPAPKPKKKEKAAVS